METKTCEETGSISIESIVEAITAASLEQTADALERSFEISRGGGASMIMIAFD